MGSLRPQQGPTRNKICKNEKSKINQKAKDNNKLSINSSKVSRQYQEGKTEGGKEFPKLPL